MNKINRISNINVCDLCVTSETKSAILAGLRKNYWKLNLTDEEVVFSPHAIAGDGSSRGSCDLCGRRERVYLQREEFEAVSYEMRDQIEKFHENCMQYKQAWVVAWKDGSTTEYGWGRYGNPFICTEGGQDSIAMDFYRRVTQTVLVSQNAQ